MECFRPLYSVLMGECFVSCIILLALYLLDLCSFKFLLVQYLMICMKCCKMYPWRAPLHVGEYPPCARIRVSITCVHAIISLWRTCKLLIICLTCVYFCPNSHIHYECVYCCFSHSNLEKDSPNALDYMKCFRPLYPVLMGECIAPCIILLALYLLDLCSFKFSLVL